MSDKEREVIGKYADRWLEEHKIAWGALSRGDVLALLKDFSVALGSGPPPWVQALVEKGPGQILNILNAIEDQRDLRRRGPMDRGFEEGLSEVVAQAVRQVVVSNPDVGERIKERVTRRLEEAFPP